MAVGLGSLSRVPRDSFIPPASAKILFLLLRTFPRARAPGFVHPLQLPGCFRVGGLHIQLPHTPWVLKGSPGRPGGATESARRGQAPAVPDGAGHTITPQSADHTGETEHERKHLDTHRPPARPCTFWKPQDPGATVCAQTRLPPLLADARQSGWAEASHFLLQPALSSLWACPAGTRVSASLRKIPRRELGAPTVAARGGFQGGVSPVYTLAAPRFRATSNGGTIRFLCLGPSIWCGHRGALRATWVLPRPLDPPPRAAGTTGTPPTPSRTLWRPRPTLLAPPLPPGPAPPGPAPSRAVGGEHFREPHPHPETRRNLPEAAQSLTGAAFRLSRVGSGPGA